MKNRSGLNRIIQTAAYLSKQLTQNFLSYPLNLTIPFILSKKHGILPLIRHNILEQNCQNAHICPYNMDKYDASVFCRENFRLFFCAVFQICSFIVINFLKRLNILFFRRFNAPCVMPNSSATSTSVCCSQNS